MTAAFAAQFRDLTPMYESAPNQVDRRLIFALQFYHANLLLFVEFLTKLEETHTRDRRPLFDPRDRRPLFDPHNSKLNQWHLVEITKDSHFLQECRTVGQRMLQTIESLLEILRLERKPETQMPKLELEIGIYCKMAEGCLSRTSDFLEHDLKFLDLGRDLSQTSSVNQLTMLATIFLPLSLASAVLSMSTRFKDLGVLLYDFFGVVVLTGALVCPIIVLLRVAEIIRGFMVDEFEKHMAKKAEDYDTYQKAKLIVVKVFWFDVITMGCLLVISFIIGMLQDIRLGVRVLGWGILAISVGPLVTLLALLCLACVFFFICAIFATIVCGLDPLGTRSREDRTLDLERPRTSEEGGNLT